MLKPTITALALAAMLGSMALAQAPASAPVSATASPSSAPNAAPSLRTTRAKDRKDEVVCKQLAISGTRILGPKTCMTRRDWKSIEGRGMEEIEAAIRASRTRNCAGC
jgi:hypothetical protein